MRRRRLLLALSVVGLGLIELALHFHFSRAAPDAEAWRALEPAVEKSCRPDTLIVVAPEWAEPNARFAFGDNLMPLAHVARADASRFEAALEISILGQHSPELAAWKLLSEERHGAFLLRRLSNPRVEPVRYDFVAQLSPPHATVSVSRQDASDDCRFVTNAKVENGDLHGHPTFPKHRFVCPGEGNWLFAGVTVIEDQHYRPRQCIWAHPAKKGALTLRFDAVPLGSKIRGYGALPYWLERDSKGSAVELSVKVGGETVGIFSHRDGEGWKPFEFDTTRFSGQTAAVTFEVRSKRTARREFCFQADVR